MNAIERIRARGADFQDILSGPEVDRWMADVAAVEALYQAAKALGELRLGPGAEPYYAAENSAWHALAAAVRRVEDD